MNRHTLRVLEFEKIRARVRDRCLTAEAARALRKERISTDRDEIGMLLGRVGLVKRCLGVTTEFPTLSFPPIAHPLERLEKEGVVLEPLEIA